jgi:predicted secreted protein
MPVDVNNDGVTDGNGFGFYITGEFFLMTMAALPAAGTEWTLRTYNGYVYQDADGMYQFQTNLPVTGNVSGNGTLRQIGRNASVTGLEAVVEVSAPGVVSFATGAASLENVHTVPDPYYVTSSLEVTASQKVIKFVNLPPQANIRIYSVSGILVDVVDHNDIAGGGEAVWDVRNRNGQFVASGVYFYHVEAADGSEKVGRFTVVNSSGINSGGASN